MKPEDIPSDEAHLIAAQALTPRSTRNLAIAIKSARGLMEKDLRKLPGGPEGDVSQIVESLAKAGIATIETVAVCSKTGNQIARISNEASLDELTQLGIRCGCGESLTDMSIHKLYLMTDAGSFLLDKSRWMSIVVRKKLEDLGVLRGDILLECQIGSDEIDCIALVCGEIAMFELKDKTFSIGNAYSFGAKVSIVKPKHSIIVTTEAVSKDVITHFDRANSSKKSNINRREANNFHYVEGERFIENLDSVMGSMFTEDAKRDLDRAMSLIQMGSRSMVNKITSNN